MKLIAKYLLPLLIIFHASCTSENSQPIAEIEYECVTNSTEEIFIVIEEEPVFGTAASDLTSYFETATDSLGISQVESGEVVLIIVVYDTGGTCLSKVTGTGMPEESLSNYQSIINEMPSWLPGKQGGIERNTYVRITVVISNGEIDEVLSVVGR